MRPRLHPLRGLRLALSAWILVAVAAPGVAQRRGPRVDEAALAHHVEVAEYRPAARGGDLTAPNRVHGLRLRWSEKGARVEDRTTGTHLATLSTVAIGRGDQRRVLPPVPPQEEAGRVVRRWDGLTEWWVNAAKGVEEGWTVTSRPEGAGPLRLWVEVEGAQVEDGTDGLVLRAENGRLLAYGGLTVADGRGRTVPAQLRRETSGFAVELDDGDAEYPLTIDPLLTSAAWTTESNQADANLGASVAGAGDVNGDGFSDVLVGAPSYDNGEADEGRVLLFFGSAWGLASTPAWTAESNQAGALFGSSVAGAGDVNGDGFSDVVVGSYRFDNGETDEGRVFLYLGGASGLAATPAQVVESNQAGAHLGVSVAGAGDVNGDGFSDVVVGADRYDNGEVNEGRAFLFIGTASGIQTTPAWTAESNQADATFGVQVAAAGDVNGDGYSDVLVGASTFDNGETDEGRAFLFTGSPAGLGAAPAWTFEPNQVGAALGFAVSGVGDVDGDGYSDVAVGALWFDNGETDEGRVFFFRGGSAGLPATPTRTMEPNQAFASFGASVAPAGDVNGDGYADLVIGASLFDNGQPDEGRAFLYLGAAGGPMATPVWSVGSSQAGATLGRAVAGAGDVDGDGFSDVVVGAPLLGNGETNEGRALVFLGTALGLPFAPVWLAESNQANARFGFSAAGAGDVNGDGFSDVVVGAYSFDNGEADEGRAALFLGGETGLSANPVWVAESNQAGAMFGYSVAGAGDVNGDGYADVIVGAPFFDNGEVDEGGAFLFLGSATGLSATPIWTAEPDHPGARFGFSVAGAGDVDGDGYSDVVVGAQFFSNGENSEGLAVLYRGGAQGPSSVPAWSVEGNQDNAELGISVAGAGDVNADGFADVLVGAFLYSNGETFEGRALLFEGSASGLSPTPAWTAEPNQAGAMMGWPVAGAGDVNRDGYSDVLVGAPSFSNLQNSEGAAFLYLGGAAGLSSTAAWTREGDQDGANFGSSVGGAGDVNGDGYSDVLVGAEHHDNGLSDEGRVVMYLGSATGLQGQPWSAIGGQANAWLGASVAGAGDVNADGFSDVVIGAHGFDNGQADEGRAYVYLGGDEVPGAMRGLTQFFGDVVLGPAARAEVAPEISCRGILGASTLSPVVRLEVEAKPVGVAFDAANTFTSAAARPAVLARVALQDLAPGRYHWRARAVSGDARSRWLSFGGNHESEADFVLTSRGADAGAATDGGSADAGAGGGSGSDAGTDDGGAGGGGGEDAGSGTKQRGLRVGCDCQAPGAGVLAPWLAGILLAAGRPRRKRPSP